MYQIFPVFLPNKGVVLNAPEESLQANQSPYSRNMEYFQGLIQGRTGLTKFDSTALPNGPISNGIFFKIFTGTNFVIYGTNSDLCYYDFTNLRHVFLNRTYTTGTVTILVGTPTIVTGSGTTWATNTKAGDYIKTGAGSIHSGSTWYKIQSVDSDTQLTLTSSAVAVGGGTAYVIRKTFTGTSTNIWSMKQFVDLNLSDVVLFTNGVDAPVYWTGSNQVVLVPNLPSTMLAKYVDVAFNRVIWLWTIEGGNNQPQRIRYSEPGDLTTYVAINFRDFLDENTWITGSALFANYFIVFKEREAYIGQSAPTPTIIDFSKSATCRGAKSPFSIVQKNEWLYYYAFDKKFHRWDILRDQIISEEVFPDTKNFDANQDQYIMGIDFYPKNQIRWLCPLNNTNNNYQFVFDYLHNVSEVWDCGNNNALACFITYLLTSNLYCDDPIWGNYYVDGTVGFCDDVTYLSNSPSFLHGGYDGILRQIDQGADDDGTAYTRRFRSSRLNFGQPNKRKRLWKNEFWFASDPVASLTIQLKRDDNVNFDTGINSVSLVDSTRDIVKLPVTWNKEAEDFQIDISATTFFALLGFYNIYMLKRRTFKG